MDTRIKKLGENFTGKGEVKGFIFHQVKRGQKACIYEVTSEGETHYEVFKIKNALVPKSNKLYEPYPKANSFGIWAWTFRDYNLAIKKHDSLEKGEILYRNSYLSVLSLVAYLCTTI